ncbi:unnamed protein product [Fraxinus pennsylvanica]|uniref:Squalene monooxygenase n=1 Tax=Fraxinus pennsylvanica TaxID=56036 RepID=A0AAD1ZK83_9LAMI|nr:unnamed protein product [Fraxinus pennsylvanica]
MRESCFHYLSLGSIYSQGSITLLSGLNSRPMSLVAHFFAMAIYGVGHLLLPFPSPKHLLLGARLLSIGAFAEDSSTSIVDSNNVKQEMQQSQPHVTRPASNFRKRSPVSQVKFKLIYSNKGSINSLSRGNVDGKSKEMETNAEPSLEPSFSEGNVFDQILKDETSEIF